jgi:hypothetical protein
MNGRKWVLMVHSSDEIMDTIEDQLNDMADIIGHALSFKRAKTRAQAEAYAAAKPIDLVVTALEIAADDTSPMSAGDQRSLGLELVKTLKSKMPEIRAIIVADNIVDPADLAPLEKTEWVQQGEPFHDSLKSAAERLLGSAPQPDELPLVLSISLSKDKDRCSYWFQDGSASYRSNPLDIDPAKLARLVDKTGMLGLHVNESSWELEFVDLGDDLERELFDNPNNFRFRDALNQWIGKKELENMKVRFSVDDDAWLAVEAVKGPGQTPGWALTTPICRVREPPGGNPGACRRLLFEDDATRKGPLNCLIIDADLPQGAKVRVSNEDLKFPVLSNVETEVSAIAKTLKNKNDPFIGEVRIVGPASAKDSINDVINGLKGLVKVDVPANGDLKHLIETTLRTGKWHIVHYAGHGYYDKDEHRGYVVLPNPEAELVSIEELSLWLTAADTRLVFLSGCMTAGQDFIYQLAKERVPAIMGFIWKVVDASAGKYATKFYECLLERRSLDYACLAAKKYAHAISHADPIWASAVLVTCV